MIGQGYNTQRIHRWGTAVIFGSNAPAGSLRLALHHASVDEASRLLRAYELDSIPSREDFNDLVEEIDREAAEDAAQLGWGVQRYVLRATTGEGRELGSLTVRYSSNAQTPGELSTFADSEPANARGQVALAMRHTDGAYRLLGAGFGTILDSLNRRLGQQDVLLERMMGTQERLYQMMGEMADKRIEREVWAETKKKEAEIELHRQIAELDRRDMWTKMGFERLAPLLPVVLAKLTGKGTGPMQASPRDEILAGIMESLSQEQVASLMGSLNDSQKVAFMSLIDDLQQARSPGMSASVDPGTSSPNCKPSEETGVLAIARIRRELLPWVIERVRLNETLDPPTELATVAKIFRLLVTAMPRKQYDEVVTQDGPLTAGERTAFAKFAQHLKLVPQESASRPPTGECKSPGIPIATLADAILKGMPIFSKEVVSTTATGVPEPAKPT
jgi:hypothetical protein